MSFEQQQQDWEDLGKLDPLWAVSSHPQYKFGRWDVDELFRTGDQLIQRVMETTTELGYPLGRDCALDFGCGVGRLSRALAPHFKRCYGIDISASMIEQAKALNQHYDNCEFMISSEDSLKTFADHSFDLIISFRVLQHFSNIDRIKKIIGEFVRVLKADGLLVFQLLSYIPFRKRLLLRYRLYQVLQHMGLSERFLYTRLKLAPIRMQYISKAEVTAFLAGLNASVLKVQVDQAADSRIDSRIYYVGK